MTANKNQLFFTSLFLIKLIYTYTVKLLIFLSTWCMRILQSMKFHVSIIFKCSISCSMKLVFKLNLMIDLEDRDLNPPIGILSQLSLSLYIHLYACVHSCCIYMHVQALGSFVHVTVLMTMLEMKCFIYKKSCRMLILHTIIDSTIIDSG